MNKCCLKYCAVIGLAIAGEMWLFFWMIYGTYSVNVAVATSDKFAIMKDMLLDFGWVLLIIIPFAAIFTCAVRMIPSDDM